MIRYKLKVKVWEVEVAIDADRADQYAPLIFTGPEHAVGLAKEQLLSAYGVGGHLMDDPSTPLDLAHAMASDYMASYAPVLIEGSGILTP